MGSWILLLGGLLGCPAVDNADLGDRAGADSGLQPLTNLCEQALSRLRRCPQYGENGTATATTGTATATGSCEPGSTTACAAECLIEALEVGGCDSVLDVSPNGDYINCLLECLK